MFSKQMIIASITIGIAFLGLIAFAVKLFKTPKIAGFSEIFKLKKSNTNVDLLQKKSKLSLNTLYQPLVHDNGSKEQEKKTKFQKNKDWHINEKNNLNKTKNHSIKKIFENKGKQNNIMPQSPKNQCKNFDETQINNQSLYIKSLIKNNGAIDTRMHTKKPKIKPTEYFNFKSKENLKCSFNKKEITPIKSENKFDGNNNGDFSKPRKIVLNSRDRKKIIFENDSVFDFDTVGGNVTKTNSNQHSKFINPSINYCDHFKIKKPIRRLYSYPKNESYQLIENHKLKKRCNLTENQRYLSILKNKRKKLFISYKKQNKIWNCISNKNNLIVENLLYSDIFDEKNIHKRNLNLNYKTISEFKNRLTECTNDLGLLLPQDLNKNSLIKNQKTSFETPVKIPRQVKLKKDKNGLCNSLILHKSLELSDKIMKYKNNQVNSILELNPNDQNIHFYIKNLDSCPGIIKNDKINKILKDSKDKYSKDLQNNINLQCKIQKKENHITNIDTYNKDEILNDEKITNKDSNFLQQDMVLSHNNRVDSKVKVFYEKNNPHIIKSGHKTRFDTNENFFENKSIKNKFEYQLMDNQICKYNSNCRSQLGKNLSQKIISLFDFSKKEIHENIFNCNVSCIYKKFNMDLYYHNKNKVENEIYVFYISNLIYDKKTNNLAKFKQFSIPSLYKLELFKLEINSAAYDYLKNQKKDKVIKYNNAKIDFINNICAGVSRSLNQNRVKPLIFEQNLHLEPLISEFLDYLINQNIFCKKTTGSNHLNNNIKFQNIFFYLNSDNDVVFLFRDKKHKFYYTYAGIVKLFLKFKHLNFDSKISRILLFEKLHNLLIALFNSLSKKISINLNKKDENDSKNLHLEFKYTLGVLSNNLLMFSKKTHCDFNFNKKED